jgi:hypothetical protein
VTPIEAYSKSRRPMSITGNDEGWAVFSSHILAIAFIHRSRCNVASNMVLHVFMVVIVIRDAKDISEINLKYHPSMTDLPDCDDIFWMEEAEDKGMDIVRQMLEIFEIPSGITHVRKHKSSGK